MPSKRQLENRVDDIEEEKSEEGIEIRIHQTVVDRDLEVVDEWTEVIEM